MDKGNRGGGDVKARGVEALDFGNQTVELSRKRVVSKPHSNYEQGTPKATDPEIGGMSWHPSCHSAEVALQ